MKCVYCQNYEISHNNIGEEISYDRLARIFENLEKQKVHNVNLVNPSHYVHAIIEALNVYQPTIPLVYNSGGYDSISSLKRLNGKIQVYLPDFKYGTNKCAYKYSGINNYIEACVKSIEEMILQAGQAAFDGNGIITSGVIVRHLVLPSNTNNSIEALNIIKSEFGSAVSVSLMGQFTPTGNLKNHSEIDRNITRREYEKVIDHMIRVGLDGYCQTLDSASKRYIPVFDLSGI